MKNASVEAQHPEEEAGSPKKLSSPKKQISKLRRLRLQNAKIAVVLVEGLKQLRNHGAALEHPGGEAALAGPECKRTDSSRGNRPLPKKDKISEKVPKSQAKITYPPVKTFSSTPRHVAGVTKAIARQAERETFFEEINEFLETTQDKMIMAYADVNFETLSHLKAQVVSIPKTKRKAWANPKAAQLPKWSGLSVKKVPEPDKEPKEDPKPKKKIKKPNAGKKTSELKNAALEQKKKAPEPKAAPKPKKKIQKAQDDAFYQRAKASEPSVLTEVQELLVLHRRMGALGGGDHGEDFGGGLIRMNRASKPKKKIKQKSPKNPRKKIKKSPKKPKKKIKKKSPKKPKKVPVLDPKQTEASDEKETELKAFPKPKASEMRAASVFVNKTSELKAVLEEKNTNQFPRTKAASEMRATSELKAFSKPKAASVIVNNTSELKSVFSKPKKFSKVARKVTSSGGTKEESTE